MSKYKFSKRSLDNLKGLHPDLIEFAFELIKVTPHDIMITCGVRTAEEQNKIYWETREKGKDGMIYTKFKDGVLMKHKTNCDGYMHKSNHQVKDDGLGYAFDIAVLINNKCDWDRKRFLEVADSARELMKKYKVEWGGDWKMRDYPHFELSI